MVALPSRNMDSFSIAIFVKTFQQTLDKFEGLYQVISIQPFLTRGECGRTIKLMELTY